MGNLMDDLTNKLNKGIDSLDKGADSLEKKIENVDKELSNSDQPENKKLGMRPILIGGLIMAALLGLMAILPESEKNSSTAIDGHVYMSSDGLRNFIFEDGDVQYLWFASVQAFSSGISNIEEGSYTANGNNIVIDLDERSDDWTYEYDEATDRLYILDENGNRFGSYMTQRRED